MVGSGPAQRPQPKGARVRDISFWKRRESENKAGEADSGHRRTQGKGGWRKERLFGNHVGTGLNFRHTQRLAQKKAGKGPQNGS